MSSSPASSRRQRGFTLLETVMAIVIISVGLAGVLSVFTGVTQHSADPMVRKQLLALAEEMIEEIQLKSYDGATHTAPAACARDTYNDIWDYDGYETTGTICNIDGTTLPALDGYSIEVTVETSALSGIAEAALITVEASRGGDDVTLRTWRTRFGASP